tara:strand:- start:865 stop:1035 length:171 start_codon:yes stop_codon:yes gene_type:complete
MGMSLVILFLTELLVPNLKIITTGLVATFCYDVFFVFLSPYVFGTGVMEQVASGGM